MIATLPEIMADDPPFWVKILPPQPGPKLVFRPHTVMVRDSCGRPCAGWDQATNRIDYGVDVHVGINDGLPEWLSSRARKRKKRMRRKVEKRHACIRQLMARCVMIITKGMLPWSPVKSTSCYGATKPAGTGR